MLDVLCKKNAMRCEVYTIGICDDGEYVCTNIENMIFLYAKTNNIQVDTKVWYSGEGLKNHLALGEHLDILFLDIELISMTGIEVGSYIRNNLENNGMQIIYISGNVAYARQLFKTQPLDFLVKPIAQRQIEEVLERALKIIEKKNLRFEFQCGKEYFYVPMGNIVYFVSQGRKVKIITTKSSYEFYGRLKDISKKLSEDFITIHQSYIVNKTYIYRYTYEMVELVDGTILSISPVNRKQVREIILREE